MTITAYLQLLLCLIACLSTAGFPVPSASQDQYSQIPSSRVSPSLLTGDLTQKSHKSTDTSFQVLPFDKKNLPDFAIPHPIQAGAHWKDLNGETYFLIVNIQIDAGSASTSNLRVYSFHRGNEQDDWEQGYYRKYEEPKDRPTYQASQRYIRVTDLDGNGYGEVAFLFRKKYYQPEQSHAIGQDGSMVIFGEQITYRELGVQGQLPPRHGPGTGSAPTMEPNRKVRRPMKAFQQQLRRLWEQWTLGYLNKVLEDQLGQGKIPVLSQKKYLAFGK